jgi:outer membrane protein insertion porin family
VKFAKKAALALIVIAFGAIGSSATEVSEVDFEQQGVHTLSTEQLRLNVQLRKGTQYNREILDADVKRLFNTGNFADVVSEVTNLPDDKVKVTFKLRLKPQVSRIQFKGNVKFSAIELGKQITQTEGALLNDKALQDSAQNLRKFYTEKGYTDNKITPEILPDEDGAITLVFHIEENLKLKVNNVVFDGAERFSQWDLKHSIANQYSLWNFLPFVNEYLNYGLLNRNELELDRARLREKYHEKGYLDFKIENMEITPEADDPEYVNINFKISEGEPYKVGKQSIIGCTVFSERELLPYLRQKEGETFSSTAEQATVRGIASRYGSLGYADMSCRPVRHEDFENKTVDIVYEITEGRKYFVRQVVIVGNTDTKDKVIRRDLVVHDGDPLDPARVEISRQRLLGMGYFESVKASEVGADALDEKDVIFEVAEKPTRYNFRIGAGASDMSDFFGMAEISTDNFDIMNPGNWFYGGGQRMRIQGVLGIENAGFNVDFVEPWLFDLPLRFEISGYMNLVDYDDWRENRVGFRTSLTRRIFDDFTSISVGYKFEYVKINKVSHRYKKYMNDNNQTEGQLVSQPSLSLTRDTRDSLTDPTSGYHVNLFGSVTPQFLGSSSSYYRLEAKGSYYYNFFDKAVVAMIGGKIGTVATVNRDKVVPIFERYFLGGSDSLRGFDYRSVSPTFGHGNNYGGQTMLQVTAEVTHPIWGPIRGAVFCDIGNAWRNSFELNFEDINVGVGYGLRIKLPVINAPIKLDLAYPIVNKQDYESSKLRFHFNLGFSY